MVGLSSKRGFWGACGAAALALGLASCGQPDTLRQDLIAQNEASVQAKNNDLAPAEGTYVGKVTLRKSRTTFDAVFVLHRTPETRRNPTPDDPSQTVNLPVLKGDLEFSALDNLAPGNEQGFHQLLHPLGWAKRVLFDLGDFDPATHQLVLPYNVPGYSGPSFGVVTGTLQNGRLHATWFCNAFGDVGTFDMTIQPGSGS